MKQLFYALLLLFVPMLSYSQEERIVRVSEFLPPVEFNSQPGHYYSLMGNAYIKKHLVWKGSLQLRKLEPLQDPILDEKNSFVVYTKERVDELLKIQQKLLIDSFKIVLLNSVAKIPQDVLTNEVALKIRGYLHEESNKQIGELKKQIADLEEQVAEFKKQLDKLSRKP